MNRRKLLHFMVAFVCPKFWHEANENRNSLNTRIFTFLFSIFAFSPFGKDDSQKHTISHPPNYIEFINFYLMKFEQDQINMGLVITSRQEVKLDGNWISFA